jgi:hypothetical protein
MDQNMEVEQKGTIFKFKFDIEPEDEPIRIQIPDDDHESQKSDNLVKISLGEEPGHHEEDKYQEDQNKISIKIGDIDKKGESLYLRMSIF